MAHVETVIGISPPPQEEGRWLKTFYDTFNRLWQNLTLAVNGNISFGDGVSTDNISGAWATATTVAGNFTVTHNLGKLPVGYLMVKSDAFENLKFISSTTTTLTLAGQNGGAHITLFIF